MTCEKSVDLGAYLLGALAPEERRAMERHIADCAECREELLSMAALPGLLRHTPFAELPETAQAAEAMRPGGFAGTARAEAGQAGGGLTQALPLPEPSPARPPEGGPAGSGHRRPSRGRRRVLAAAGLGLAAATAAVAITLGVQQGPTPSGGSVETLKATDPVSHVSATAALTPEVWGSQVRLTLANLPSGITCHLVVHARDGSSETAGTWASGYGYGSGGLGATVPASTSVTPQNIMGMDIVTSSGQTLVKISG